MYENFVWGPRAGIIFFFPFVLVDDDSTIAAPAVAFDSDMPTRKAAWSMSYGDHRERCLYEVTEDVSSAVFSIASVRKICSLLL